MRQRRERTSRCIDSRAARATSRYLLHRLRFVVVVPPALSLLAARFAPGVISSRTPLEHRTDRREKLAARHDATRPSRRGGGNSPRPW